jgi:hypothetical protein
MLPWPLSSTAREPCDVTMVSCRVEIIMRNIYCFDSRSSAKSSALEDEGRNLLGLAGGCLRSLLKKKSNLASWRERGAAGPFPAG